MSTLPFEAYVTVLEETRRAAAAARGARAASAAVAPNEHWATQAELCALHSLRYDFVGRHDELARDAMALGSLLGPVSG